MIPEHDWRLLRALHRTALDRYCTRVLEECAATIRKADSTPHDRYLHLFRLLKERDQRLASTFDDLRRSTAIQRLAAMVAIGVVTDDEIGGFSVATRESAVALAEIQRSSKKP